MKEASEEGRDLNAERVQIELIIYVVDVYMCVYVCVLCMCVYKVYGYYVLTWRYVTLCSNVVIFAFICNGYVVVVQVVS